MPCKHLLCGLWAAVIDPVVRHQPVRVCHAVRPGLTVRGAILCNRRGMHPIPVAANSVRHVCSFGNIMRHRVNLPGSLLSDRVMKPTRTRFLDCGDVSP